VREGGEGRHLCCPHGIHFRAPGNLIQVLFEQAIIWILLLWTVSYIYFNSSEFIFYF
jgi:hypothetical protein